MTATTNIGLSTPAHGANVDTWDADPVNDNSGKLDACYGSVTSKGLTNANVALTAPEARVSVLRFSGALSGNVAINVSAIIKSWIVENTCTGAFVVTITGGSGNVVGLPPGSSQVYWDGTNVSFINLERIGAYWDYPGTAVPAWVAACTVPPYLLCDGSGFSSGTYPLLAAIIGGTTLPDARGRSRFSLNGGTNRITLSGGFGIDGNALFAGGGNQTLQTANLPPYTPSGINAPSSISIGNQGTGNTGTIVNDGVGPFNSTGIGTSWGLHQLNGTANAQTFSGSAQGGTSANTLPPGYVGGVTMIRAA